MSVGASSIGGSVSVVSLEVGVVGLVVGESARLPSTVATHAGLNAINELLLSEGEELSSSNSVSRFEAAG